VQTLEDTESDAGFALWRERAVKHELRSSMTVPFCVGDGRRGILAVYASQPCAFGPVVSEAFTHLAEEIAIGLNALRREERLSAEQAEREKAQRELSEALSAVVGAITTAFEMRDPYTAGHQNRVAEIACAIAREFDWPEERLYSMRVAAMVHDIGKISIPSEILAKPTRLTPAEWTLIKEHPETGYTILKDVPFRWPIAEGVRQHHERLDGSGYPRGLKGDQILMGARILAVADIVEAMAASRPYRPGLGLDAALKEIERQAGTLLDAGVVRVCVSLFRDKGFVLPGFKLV
jgi:HD-GYP domain-containing protein (c-di-GMP phosphodiesterase class II)